MSCTAGGKQAARGREGARENRRWEGRREQGAGGRQEAMMCDREGARENRRWEGQREGRREGREGWEQGDGGRVNKGREGEKEGGRE